MVGIHPHHVVSLRRTLGALVAAFVLAGCASTGMRGFARNDTSSNAEVERHVKRGYVPDHAYATRASNETWTIDGEPVAVSLLLPATNDRFPLVVYLPGARIVQAGLSRHVRARPVIEA